MSDALYQERIVALAKAKTGAGKLEQPTASARRDNTLCGDRVTMDVRLDDGRRIVEDGAIVDPPDLARLADALTPTWGGHQ